MNTRARVFQKRLSNNNLDGFIFSSAQNLSYLTGVFNSDAYALISKRAVTYFTDPRFKDSSKKILKGLAALKIFHGSVFTQLAQTIIKQRLKRVGFEERHLPFAEYKKIKSLLKGRTLLIPTYGVVEGLREVKTLEEISKIRRALTIPASAVNFIKDFLQPGLKELEIAAELERFIRYQGASDSSFDTIVAIGNNSAYPHHKPTLRELKNNEILLVDMGVDYLGYKSDLTRAFFLGKINTLVLKIYNIVKEAQRLAIKEIRPGKSCAQIDAVARNYIASKGYAKNFTHSLGHGIGLNVHESPHITCGNNEILREGMVFTVEPAIYLPGKFGVRIEDMVLVIKNGCEVLSGSINK
jgi:Xaa-Pro aminopeptidase